MSLINFITLQELQILPLSCEWLIGIVPQSRLITVGARIISRPASISWQILQIHWRHFPKNRMRQRFHEHSIQTRTTGTYWRDRRMSVVSVDSGHQCPEHWWRNHHQPLFKVSAYFSQCSQNLISWVICRFWLEYNFERRNPRWRRLCHRKYLSGGFTNQTWFAHRTSGSPSGYWEGQSCE